MALYHGTTGIHVESILTNGLVPRQNRPSMWDVVSSPDAVYLTDAYAPYFSDNACNLLDTDIAAVVVIDHTKLLPDLLLADEDALEQSFRGYDDVGGTMEERTEYYRGALNEMANEGYDGQWSLGVLGTCSYHGIIPTSAIKRIIQWDTRKATSIPFIFDPIISVLNYTFVGEYYRYLMAVMAREPAKPLSDFATFGRTEFIEGATKYLLEHTTVISNAA